MIVRFLTEGLVQTLDISKDQKDFPSRFFPDYITENPADMKLLLVSIYQAKSHAVSSVKFVLGKDWVVFGTVKGYEGKAYLDFVCCYCIEKNGKKKWWRNVFSSPDFPDTKKNIVILAKSVEEGMRMVSTIRDYNSALKLLKEMLRGSTRWGFHVEDW